MTDEKGQRIVNELSAINKHLKALVNLKVDEMAKLSVKRGADAVEFKKAYDEEKKLLFKIMSKN